MAGYKSLVAESSSASHSARLRLVGGGERGGASRGIPVSEDGVPDAGGGGVSCVVAEVPRLPPERALDPVGQVGVAPVEHLAEQVGQQVDDVGRQPCAASSAAYFSSDTGA